MNELDELAAAAIAAPADATRIEVWRMPTCERCGEERVPNTLHVCDELVPLLRLAPRSSPTLGSRTRGVGRLVVGYRPGSRRILENMERFGLEAHAVRKCFAGCGYPVLFYSGGIDAVNDRDAEVVCDVCKAEFYGDLMAEL